jgi:lysophospholipase L1-like esterase
MISRIRTIAALATCVLLQPAAALAQGQPTITVPAPSPVKLLPAPPLAMSDNPCPAVAAVDLARDFGNLCRYKPDNARIGNRASIVFMGDSITEFWQGGDPTLFVGGTVDRGIAGQTTPQMLLRFYQDVVALHPQVVHIMAGTNNVAGNTGPSSPADYRNDIRAMVDLAQANGIKVVLGSILPTERFPWRPDLRPVTQVRLLNMWLKTFARERRLIFADYYTALATPTGALPTKFSADGVHPNNAGYAAMQPVVLAALMKAVARK